jgi:calcium-dependent protein kinase
MHLCVINFYISLLPVIIQLLQTDVAARSTLDEAMQHPWLTGSVIPASLDESVVASLRKFHAVSKFQQAICNLMAHDLSPAMAHSFKDMFDSLDKNKDGTVTLDELSEVLYCKLPSS